jgi:hypothetical protein
VFHFNKGHLTDPTIPMWVIKAHGVTFYVDHVTAEIPWTTKETPDNEHTKGSLKFKNCKLSIDEHNCATLSKIGFLDKKLPHPKLVVARIIANYSGEFHQALKRDEFKHGQIKPVEGGCGSSFIVCELLDKNEYLMAALKYAGKFRVLKPNEAYYQAYDAAGNWIAEEYDELDFEDE